MFFSPPVVKLENAKGISKDNLLVLTDDLNKMALKLCGEVASYNSIHCSYVYHYILIESVFLFFYF